jgi:hypothetical protein
MAGNEKSISFQIENGRSLDIQQTCFHFFSVALTSWNCSNMKTGAEGVGTIKMRLFLIINRVPFES